jgi:hypothetical protein
VTTSDEITHEDPVWRERANFIIAARINTEDTSARWKWEQLWAKQISEDHFEICCIPFYVHDLALGDVVETGLEGEERYVIQRVIKQSGHYTFRVWFTDPDARETVPEEIVRLGCLIEWRWSTSNFLAIDASTDILAQTIANLLYEREQLGYLEYETGRTI